MLRNWCYLGLVLGEALHAGGEVAVDEGEKLVTAAFVQAADDSDVLNLFRRELTVGTVNRGEDVAGVDEEDAVVGLALIEEPERSREGDGVEHVRRQGEHAVDEIILDEGLADVGLGVACIKGGIGHDKAARPPG